MDARFRRILALMRGVCGIFLTLFLLCSDAEAREQPKPRVIHVFVALADNEHQGIIPVPAALGNGDDPSRNLYWGAAFGVRTFLRKSSDWREVLTTRNPFKGILERSVFQHRTQAALLVADAYRGSEIKQALTDFFRAAAGIHIHEGQPTPCIVSGVLNCAPEDTDLVVYVGHDGLMDAQLAMEFPKPAGGNREAIVLACASKAYFANLLRASGAQPLLWTTGLMAPEAYTLKAAVDGWILHEKKEEIRRRAASAYAQYQKCGLAAALRLFSAEW